MVPINSNSVQRSQSPEELRAWLRNMTDAQLLEFGKAAASVCRPPRNRPVREVFREQLREARAEWRRRHPEMEAHA